MQGMQVIRRSQPLQRGHRPPADLADRHLAGHAPPRHRGAPCTPAATQPAPILRRVEPEVVAQHVEQRRVRRRHDIMNLPVDIHVQW